MFYRLLLVGIVHLYLFCSPILANEKFDKLQTFSDDYRYKFDKIKNEGADPIYLDIVNHNKDIDNLITLEVKPYLKRGSNTYFKLNKKKLIPKKNIKISEQFSFNIYIYELKNIDIYQLSAHVYQMSLEKNFWDGSIKNNFKIVLKYQKNKILNAKTKWVVKENKLGFAILCGINKYSSLSSLYNHNLYNLPYVYNLPNQISCEMKELETLKITDSDNSVRVFLCVPCISNVSGLNYLKVDKNNNLKESNTKQFLFKIYAYGFDNHNFFDKIEISNNEPNDHSFANFTYYFFSGANKINPTNSIWFKNEYNQYALAMSFKPNYKEPNKSRIYHTDKITQTMSIKVNDSTDIGSPLFKDWQGHYLVPLSNKIKDINDVLNKFSNMIILDVKTKTNKRKDYCVKYTIGESIDLNNRECKGKNEGDMFLLVENEDEEPLKRLIFYESRSNKQIGITSDRGELKITNFVKDGIVHLLYKGDGRKYGKLKKSISPSTCKKITIPWATKKIYFCLKDKNNEIVKDADLKIGSQNAFKEYINHEEANRKFWIELLLKDVPHLKHQLYSLTIKQQPRKDYEKEGELNDVLNIGDGTDLSPYVIFLNNYPETITHHRKVYVKFKNRYYKDINLIYHPITGDPVNFKSTQNGIVNNIGKTGRIKMPTNEKFCEKVVQLDNSYETTIEPKPLTKTRKFYIHSSHPISNATVSIKKEGKIYNGERNETNEGEIFYEACFPVCSGESYQITIIAHSYQTRAEELSYSPVLQQRSFRMLPESIRIEPEPEENIVINYDLDIQPKYKNNDIVLPVFNYDSALQVQVSCETDNTLIRGSDFTSVDPPSIECSGREIKLTITSNEFETYTQTDTLDNTQNTYTSEPLLHFNKPALYVKIHPSKEMDKGYFKQDKYLFVDFKKKLLGRLTEHYFSNFSMIKITSETNPKPPVIILEKNTKHGWNTFENSPEHIDFSNNILTIGFKSVSLDIYSLLNIPIQFFNKYSFPNATPKGIIILILSNAYVYNDYEQQQNLIELNRTMNENRILSFIIVLDFEESELISLSNIRFKKFHFFKSSSTNCHDEFNRSFNTFYDEVINVINIFVNTSLGL